MTAAEFKAIVAEIVTSTDGTGQGARIDALNAELISRGLTVDEASQIVSESMAAQAAKAEAARAAARASKLAAIRTALGLS